MATVDLSFPVIGEKVPMDHGDGLWGVGAYVGFCFCEAEEWPSCASMTAGRCEKKPQVDGLHELRRSPEGGACEFSLVAKKQRRPGSITLEDYRTRGLVLVKSLFEEK